jgi:hypothetical protein
MKPSITATEIDLFEFFGTESKTLDPIAPWPYNKFSYEARSGQLAISFVIEPASRDVRIAVSSSSAVLYELTASGVEDVKVHMDGNKKTLEVAASTADKIWVRIRPDIQVTQQIGG